MERAGLTVKKILQRRNPFEKRVVREKNVWFVSMEGQENAGREGVNTN